MRVALRLGASVLLNDPSFTASNGFSTYSTDNTWGFLNHIAASHGQDLS